jgi:hypothetical protein
MSLARGWLFKILIVAGLFKAIQAAIAFENERKHVLAESDEPAGVVPEGPAEENLGAAPVHD